MKWSARFSPVIKLPDGRKLATLHEARAYILKLPDKTSAEPRWQTAAETLLHAADSDGNGVWMFLARIGMMQALSGKKPSRNLIVPRSTE